MCARVGVSVAVNWNFFFFFFQAEDGIRDYKVTGVQTCALPISIQTTLQLSQQISLESVCCVYNVIVFNGLFSIMSVFVCKNSICLY